MSKYLLYVSKSLFTYDRAIVLLSDLRSMKMTIGTIMIFHRQKEQTQTWYDQITFEQLRQYAAEESEMNEAWGTGTHDA
jgi:hypothetical protein